MAIARKKQVTRIELDLKEYEAKWLLNMLQNSFEENESLEHKEIRESLFTEIKEALDE